MSKEPSYFLVPATSGLCIQSKNDGIFTAELDGEPRQQWFVEQGRGRTVAFKNAQSGDYLRSSDWKLRLGSKRYWVLEPSNTPNAFRIRLDDQSPDRFLCNTDGKYWADNPISTCSDSRSRLQTTLWYIHDYDSWNDSKSWPLSRPKSSSSELDAKDKSIREKQAQIDQKEIELKEKQIELEKLQKDAEKREREALECEQQVKTKTDEAAPMKQELVAERIAIRDQTTKQKETSTADDDDNHWLQRFAKLQQRLETAHKEIERLRVQSNESENETVMELRRELKQIQQGAQEQKAAYTTLRQKVEAEAEASGIGADPGIKARRLHTPVREFEAANVGERWAPPGFRAGRDTAITRGEVKPIAMPREFTHLARLR